MIFKPSKSQALQYAKLDFSRAHLGDSRRNNRLLSIATAAFLKPHGLIKATFEDPNERQNAYRFIESPHIRHLPLIKSTALGTLNRANGLPYVFVPIDGSSLKLTDRCSKRGMGHIGTYEKGAKGLKVLTAMAVDPQGTPLGLLEQKWWARRKDRKRKAKNRQSLPFGKKETRHWLEVMDTVSNRFKKSRSKTIPWFQIDAEGDFRQLLDWLARTPYRVTVRSGQNRRLSDEDDAPRYLKQSLRKATQLGNVDIEVSETQTQTAGYVRLTLRAKQVDIQLRDRKSGRRKRVKLWALLAREEGEIEDGLERLEWLLLTNVPIRNFSTAQEILKGYGFRWRIEDFHKTWKSWCHVEKTRLHARSVKLWATILAAVAMRIERLKHLSRNQPEEPATVEFSQEEIDAVILLKGPEDMDLGSVPTIGQVVTWIAELGSWNNYPSSPPPGSKVISRGMEKLPIAIKTLEKINFRRQNS